MARAYDPFKLSSPRIFLVRIAVFLALAALIALVLWRPIWQAFLANPGLNGVILGVMAVGIALAVRQVARLFAEVAWVNGMRIADPGAEVARPPVLLAPMAALLGDRVGRMAISQATMRGIMDSIGNRLDESRDVLRYLTGLLVFLGLIGTFWGLIDTIGSIGKVVAAMEVGPDAGAMFEDLKAGLSRPLGGMGIAFSSSLFGLAGSLVLGFLDLQAGQAQTRFYTDLEDWLASVVRDIGGGQPQPADEHSAAALAGSIRGLIEQMRSEQAVLRRWVEAQAAEQREIRQLLERLVAPSESGRR